MKGRISKALTWSCTIIVCIATLWTAPPSASACSRGPTAIEDDFLSAHSIFTAKVTRLDPVYPSHFMAAVETMEVLKGQPPAFVITGNDSDRCGAGLQAGESYLFYSHGLESPSVSVFDTHLFGTDRMEKLHSWLLERTREQESKSPRTDPLLAYNQGEIQIKWENHNRGRPEKAFLANNSVYVPLSFFSDNLWFSTEWNANTNEVTIGRTNRMEFETISEEETHRPAGTGDPQKIDAEYKDITIRVESRTGTIETLSKHPEAFIASREVYVPLRAISEQLGYEVEWQSHSYTAVLHLPLEQKNGPQLLSIRFIQDSWKGDALEVERLTTDEITYRSVNLLKPASISDNPVTVPFAEMAKIVKMEDEFPKFIVQFYLKMDQRDIVLFVTPELLRKMESDATFRELVGSRLGKPLDSVPVNRLLTEADMK